MITKPLTKAYFEEVRKRTESATSGPWVPFIEGRDFPLGGDSFVGRGKDRCEEDLYLNGGTIADIDFVANARQDIPLLLEEIDRLLKLLEQNERS